MEELFPAPGHNALVCCSSRLSHLYAAIQWDHIHAPGLQILIIKALPHADKFTDLIYMKQNFLTQLGKGWEKKSSHQSLFIWNLMPTNGFQKIYASCFHTNHKFLQELLILTSHLLSIPGLSSRSVPFIGITGLVSLSNHPMNSSKMCLLAWALGMPFLLAWRKGEKAM